MRLGEGRLGIVAYALAVLAIAGCGSSKKSSSATGTSGASASTASVPAQPPIASVAALVPAKYKSQGTVTVAADASYPPDEFIAPDGHTVIGMDVDLMNAIGGAMGLKVKVVNATFDGILPGLASGKYDVGASSFTDTKAREKTVDFVTYYVAGTSFFTKSQGGTTVNTIADLCGHTVAVEKGTTEQTDASKQGDKCKKAGKPGVTVLVFPDQNGVNLAIQSGRAQLGMVDSPVAAYQVKKSNGLFKLTGKTYGPAIYGIAVPKGSGLAKPIFAALKGLMSNGTYTRILTNWGIQAGAITNPKINGAAS